MKLLEYEAKQFFKIYGIPIPNGNVVTSSEEATKIAKKIGSVAIKSQLPIGGRGKAGGIKFADYSEEVARVAEELLGSYLEGLKIEKLLVEEKLDILDEIYLGVIIDRKTKSYTILASSEGGVNIEEVATTNPEKIVRYSVDPINGFRIYHSRLVAKRVGYSGKDMMNLANILMKLFQLAQDMDAELTEINPLAVTPDGFVAADARLNIDNNALYRHPDLAKNIIDREKYELSPRELEGRELNLSYVELDGNIGIIGNGAGLTMATIDTVTLKGGKPANFLDLGGGASSELIKTAVIFVLSDPRVDVLFVNILGGITRCDIIARGIVQARNNTGSKKPIITRLMGTNEEEGRSLLKKEGVETLDTMEQAAERAVTLARGY